MHAWVLRSRDARWTANVNRCPHGAGLETAEMEIVLAAVVAATVSAAVVMLSVRRLRPAGVVVTERTAAPIEAPRGTEQTVDDGRELDVRRAEIARIEERLLSKQEALDVRLAEVSRKDQSLDDR